MADYTVVLNPTLQPICDPATCQHPLENRVSVNSRVVKGKRGRQQIATDALFCLCCGKELVGDLPWGVAFHHAWDKLGWHAGIGGRLWDVMNIRADDGSLTWPEEAEDRLNNGTRLLPVELMTWREAARASQAGE